MALTGNMMDRKKNTHSRSVLWIVTTQWRGQAWGRGGDPNVATPVLDNLATRGLNYRQATTPHPFGPFARAAMLTGLLSPANGVCDYYDPLPTEAQTIAHRMNAAGSRTAFFGKWHLGDRDRSAPLVGEIHARQIVPTENRGGFEFWEGFESGFLLNDPWLHGSRLPRPTQFPGYQSDVLASRARQWISEQDEPWFSMVSMEAPHPPYAASTPSGVSRIDPLTVELRDNVPPETSVRARDELAGYYAHIVATDRAIGTLIEGLAGDVTIVVTSAHGDMHGSHGRFRKGWPWDESIRVPLVVLNAPNSRSGAEDDTPVSLVDLPAMAMAWGRNETWVCPRDYAPISMPSVVALPDQCDRVWEGRRTARGKEINRADGSPWLGFDLESDPLEMRNLVSS